jgi:hypothetical protein
MLAIHARHASMLASPPWLSIHSQMTRVNPAETAAR